ncbi:TrmO family methyltransferase domain-containing protein [Streptomyces lonarensis]|uniref:TsaA-like domain-containing protein n=1 Tax=Streptomyces lonarensis TaxID=700599 RepID=A0A7X6D388_9ACTN|nr:hypothetical protein [Streptomyces lonarensis]
MTSRTSRWSSASTSPTSDLHAAPRRPRNNPDRPAGGMFAHRTMRRRTWIGVSRCRLLEIGGLDRQLSERDAVDGTPGLDSKPRFPDPAASAERSPGPSAAARCNRCRRGA